MRIALDATYSVDRYPSGIAVYSSEILSGLATAYPQDRFLHCYRLKQFGRTARSSFPNVQKNLLLPPLATFHAGIFHALNQRVDRRPAKSVVCTFHDLFVMTSEYSSASFRKRFTAQAKTAARNSDIIIAVSQFTADQVADLLDFPRAWIRVVPHGVRPPKTVPRERKKIILFVGALQVRKNPVRLVEAFERLPGDWRLVLAGANGFGAEKILERIERSRARERICVKGYVSRQELDALYANAAIFAFPSLAEGFGMPVLDAMANGIPVLTSNTSSLAEVVGNAAVLVNPEDSDAIYAGLLMLSSDPELRDRYVKRGLARAEEYPWERTIRETYNVYEELRP